MRPRWRRSIIALGVGALLALSAGNAFAGMTDPRIAVLVSHQSAPYAETLAGFHMYLAGQGLSPRYVTYTLDGNGAKASRAARDVKRDGTDMVFSLGNLATESAIKEIPDVPVVAGMILRPEVLGKSPNATGVTLEFPIETQFRWLRRILPDARTVGVLYNPRENLGRIESASRVAGSLGLRLEARKVVSPQDLPGAIESLSKQADALWSLYDTVALTPETARHILLFSFRNRVPVVGLSASWVKAGALYSLDWDYNDLGIQCGETALKILRGAPARSIPPAPPRKATYSLNLNTARQMRVDLPDALVSGAAAAY